MKFKSDFLWGAATAAYQVEGAAHGKIHDGCRIAYLERYLQKLGEAQSLCQLWATSTGLLWITLSGHVDIRSASDWFMWIIRPRSGL